MSEVRRPMANGNGDGGGRSGDGASAAVHEAGEQMRQKTREAGEQMRARTREAGEELGVKAREVTQQVRERRAELEREVEQRAERWSGELGDRFDRVARALHSAGEALEDEGEGRMSGAVSGLADQIERMSGYLHDENPRAMVDDVENLAPRNPGVFLGATFIAGMLAGRFLRSSEPTAGESGAERPTRVGAAPSPASATPAGATPKPTSETPDAGLPSTTATRIAGGRTGPVSPAGPPSRAEHPRKTGEPGRPQPGPSGRPGEEE